MSQTTSRPTRRTPTIIPTQRTVHDTELVDDMGELIDAIDEVLEENALEVTSSYHQRGGQ